MLNTNIQAVLKKYLSVLSILLHLINLDIRCWSSKLIWAFDHLNETFYLENSVPWDVKTLSLYGLIFTVLDYGFIWFNFYLDFLE